VDTICKGDKEEEGLVVVVECCKDEEEEVPLFSRKPILVQQGVT
jgi:hypothetical protein